MELPVLRAGSGDEVLVLTDRRGEALDELTARLDFPDMVHCKTAEAFDTTTLEHVLDDIAFAALTMDSRRSGSALPTTYCRPVPPGICDVVLFWDGSDESAELLAKARAVSDDPTLTFTAIDEEGAASIPVSSGKATLKQLAALVGEHPAATLRVNQRLSWGNLVGQWASTNPAWAPTLAKFGLHQHAEQEEPGGSAFGGGGEGASSSLASSPGEAMREERKQGAGTKEISSQDLLQMWLIILAHAQDTRSALPEDVPQGPCVQADRDALKRAAFLCPDAIYAGRVNGEAVNALFSGIFFRLTLPMLHNFVGCGEQAREFSFFKFSALCGYFLTCPGMVNVARLTSVFHMPKRRIRYSRLTDRRECFPCWPRTLCSFQHPAAATDVLAAIWAQSRGRAEAWVLGGRARRNEEHAEAGGGDQPTPAPWVSAGPTDTQQPTPSGCRLDNRWWETLVDDMNCGVTSLHYSSLLRDLSNNGIHIFSHPTHQNIWHEAAHFAEQNRVEVEAASVAGRPEPVADSPDPNRKRAKLMPVLSPASPAGGA